MESRKSPHVADGEPSRPKKQAVPDDRASPRHPNGTASQIILGFPCNQNIGQFCELNHGVAFPLMAKSDLNGDSTNKVYKWLKNQKAGILSLTRMKWNFEKFLIDREGKVVHRWASTLSLSLSPRHQRRRYHGRRSQRRLYFCKGRARGQQTAADGVLVIAGTPPRLRVSATAVGRAGVQLEGGHEDSTEARVANAIATRRARSRELRDGRDDIGDDEAKSEPLIPATTKFILTTNGTLLPPASESFEAQLNTHAYGRYFDRPEVQEAYKAQQLIQTPEFIELPQDANEALDTSDAAYEKRHRKYESFEKRQRLREKEKLKHEHYKLKERIDQLRAMDSSAFLALPSSDFLPARHATPGPSGQQQVSEVGEDVDASNLHGAAAYHEGERRRKAMLESALQLEQRYRTLLPPDRRWMEKKLSEKPNSHAASAEVVEEEEEAMEEELDEEGEEEVEAIQIDDLTCLQKLKEIGTNPSSPKALRDLLMRWVGSRSLQISAPLTRTPDRRLGEALSSLTPASVPPWPPIWTLDELYLLPKGRIKYYNKLYNRVLDKLDKLLATLDSRMELRVGDDAPTPEAPAPIETEDEVVIDMFISFERAHQFTSPPPMPGYPGDLPPPRPGFLPRSDSSSSLPNMSSGSLHAPQHRPLLPSAQMSMRSVSTAGSFSIEGPSPPGSPAEETQPTGTVSSVISAQMKCKVFLKREHAQWKSLGSARLRLYREDPTNVKQLVVDADNKDKTVLILTIVLTDGVERVGKTGIAIELSDKGVRTGIVYMLQLRNEKSADGLFNELSLVRIAPRMA
ncbi:hypothetical protein ONZ51_g11522 [Trametes cubensis]|uniref:PEHE domain-containing protein n=1 Tax=Trametes cubensis TaxID=1111947 RepID=A0AAD7TJZ8_9APHY|nr:hypothetical protein ONZ51_g11522 [Trametes cubensis]